jgi:hypothetical protein
MANPASCFLEGGRPRAALLFLLFTSLCAIVRAQGNYEIQVYGSDTVPRGRTMVEIHSNFTVEGSSLSPSSSSNEQTLSDGTLPTNHQLHETVEITRGWNSWFETGFYIFTSAGPDQGYKWVGDHIRPRVRVPDSWKWPVGVSLSTEIGYQRPLFSQDTWTWEIRPIVDKQLGRWYLSFNPALERSWHGPSVGKSSRFHPTSKPPITRRGNSRSDSSTTVTWETSLTLTRSTHNSNKSYPRSITTSDLTGNSTLVWVSG